MALYCDKERKYNFCQKKMKTRMDRGSDEEWRRVKTDFSLAIAELWHGQGFRESNPVIKNCKRLVRNWRPIRRSSSISSGTL